MKAITVALEKLGIAADCVGIWGSGEPYREFLHVDDLAQAAVFIMDRYEYKETGEFVNIGAGEDIRLNDLALLVKNVVEFDGKIHHDLAKQDGMPKKLLDISLATRLGWKARIDLTHGITTTYAWYTGIEE